MCESGLPGADYQAFWNSVFNGQDWQRPCWEKLPEGEFKTEGMRKFGIIGSVACAGILALQADTTEQKKRFEQEFRHVPIAELPARAAAVVRSTPAAERSQAAVIAVETIVAQHPASAPTVVSAVAKAAPETGAAAAAAATRLAPGEAASIAAAVRAVPQKAGAGKALSHEGNSGSGSNNKGQGSNNSGNGNANGGVGHGPGPNKPGNPVVHDRPINTVLPNGKPRHFPPNPPHRPVNPPRPHKYNKPKPH